MNDDTQDTSPTAPLSFSETFRHYDSMMWQVPSVAVAIAMGTVAAAAQVSIDDAAGWAVSPQSVRGLILLVGALPMCALSVAVYKYRIFLSATSPSTHPTPPFSIPPRAGKYLQMSMFLITSLTIGLSIAQLTFYPISIAICAAAGLISTFCMEREFERIEKKIDEKKSVSTKICAS